MTEPSAPPWSCCWRNYFLPGILFFFFSIAARLGLWVVTEELRIMSCFKSVIKSFVGFFSEPTVTLNSSFVKN